MKKKRKRHPIRNGPQFDDEGYEEDFDGVDPKNLVRVDPPPGFPTPAEVAKMLKKAKITIILDDGTVMFFKREAKKHGVSYQQMIRAVLREYASRKKRKAA